MIHKSIIKSGAFLGKLISKLLYYNVFFKFYNFIYEHSSWFIIRLFVKFIELPDKDNQWSVFLPNEKKVITKIVQGNLKTRQFALSYKWHSPSINFTEEIVNNYYTNDIPWIDIGANLGLRSLLPLSEKRPVYFIEPNDELNKINRERCQLNGFSKYTFLTFGASDKAGEIEFFIDESSYCSSIEQSNLKENSIEKIETIKIETIDCLFAEQINIWKTAYIKIDVEGHELKVLEGAKRFISKLAPTMIIEVSEKGSHFLAFFEKMQKFGYTIYEIRRFSSNRFFRKVNAQSDISENPIKSNDFLCVKNPDLINIIEKHTV